jgi:hypothetical protein
MSDTELMHMRRGVLLHDIGKMGFRTGFRKKGPLNEDEVRHHADASQYAYPPDVPDCLPASALISPIATMSAGMA